MQRGIIIVKFSPHHETHTHSCNAHALVRSWHIELYLTPSNLVYSTAGVLCALAVGIAIIIGLLLQAREKVTMVDLENLYSLL